MYYVFHKLSQVLVTKGTDVYKLASMYSSKQYEIVFYA